MLKRLGMWNRLALALTVLAVLLAPPIAGVSVQNQLSQARETWLTDCRRLNEGTGKHDLKGYLEREERCWDDFTKPYDGPSWDFYWEVAYGTLAICAVLYLLIWLTVATVKWIWRGRSVTRGNRT